MQSLHERMVDTPRDPNALGQLAAGRKFVDNQAADLQDAQDLTARAIDVPRVRGSRIYDFVLVRGAGGALGSREPAASALVELQG
jgi:hypothetical protein